MEPETDLVIDLTQPTIPFCRPLIDQDEIDSVVATLRGDWITTGPRVQQFSQDFAAAVEAEAAMAVSSCTAALHLALLAMGIGEGHAVFTTTMTFASTVHVIEHVGATPVLIDIDPVTMNIDVDELERAIVDHRGPETPAAVIPVHFAGLPVDMRRIEALARYHGLAVIEDAAHGIPGQSIAGRPMGRPIEDLDHFTAFSFYATKNLATGEGGMLTASPSLLDKAQPWSLHGMSRDAWRRYEDRGAWYYDVVQPGFKYNMTDLQAALGLVQLRRLSSMQRRRQEIGITYFAALGDLEELEMPAVPAAGTGHSWHLFVLRLNLEHLRIGRDQFIDELAARGISTSVHFIPIHEHQYYRDRYRFESRDFPVASETFERIISLPLYPAMTDEEVGRVTQAVRDVVRSYSRRQSVTATES